MRRRHRLISLTRQLLRVLMLTLLTGLSVVLVAWLTLHWGILPHIDRWRPEVEQQASRVLGVQVRIGQMAARSSAWVPTLELTEVVLTDASGRTALRLPRVVAAVSPQTLLVLAPRFSQLYLEGAQLELRRDREGGLHLGGFDLASAGRLDAGALADWLFEQPEVAVRRGQLRWLDESRGPEPLLLQDVDLVLRNTLRHHDMRLDATPPEGWGRRFTLVGKFRQSLLASAGDWQRWSGTVHADLPWVDLAALNRHADLPFELREGRGALQLWLDTDHAQWRSLTADLALDAVHLRLGRSLEPLRLARLQTRVEARRLTDGIRLSADQLSFATHDGLKWPAGRMVLAWQQAQLLGEAPRARGGQTGAAPQAVTGGEFSADRLDLALLTRIATRIPLPETWRQRLRDMQPRGVIEPVTMTWRGPIEQPRQWRVKAELADLGLNGVPSASPEHPGVPGIRGLSATFEATEAGGSARLKVADGGLDLPGVFEEPLLPLDHLEATAAWRIGAPGPGGAPRPLELQLTDLRLANADTRGDLQVRWRTGEGRARWPGHLDLTGRLDRVAATRVPRYLPLGVHAEVRQYLVHALQAGTAHNVQFRVKGDLDRFPFLAGDGQFRIALRAQDATLAYGPPDAQGVSRWPALTQVQGELVFDRDRMEIRDASARQWGVALSGVHGGISQLGHGSRLVLEGQGRGPAADLLRFANESPVAGWTRQALAQASLTGTAELKLALDLPLADLPRSTVKGSVQLQGGDLRLRPGLPLLAATRARVEFTETGFAVQGGRAEVAGGETQFEGNSLPDGGVRFTAQGEATAEALRDLVELGDVRRLARHAHGRTGYRLQFGQQADGRTELRLNSSLAGLELDLPRPLRKTADTVLPLSLHLADLTVDAGRAPRDLLRVELGPVLAEYLRDTSAATPRVLRGLLQVGEARTIADPESVVAAARVQALNLDAWLETVRRLQAEVDPVIQAVSAPALQGEAPAPAAPVPPAPAAPATALAGYLPRQIHLQAQRLTLGGRTYTPVDARIQRLQALDNTRWLVNLQSAAVSGQIDYHPSSHVGSAGRLQARLSHFALPPPDAPDEADGSAGQAPAQAAPVRLISPVAPVDLPAGPPGQTAAPSHEVIAPALQAQLEAVAQAADAARRALAADDLAVPALDVVIEDLELRGKKAGRLEALANYRGQGSDRLWLLSRLRLGVPEAQFNASGSWTPGADRRVALDFTVDIRDSGSLVDRLGVGRAVRGGSGRMSGQLSWNGSPLAPDWKQATGHVALALDAGQFLRAEPGAARFLGVLSFQSLARRLQLDFRDVFQEGFTFDNVSGDIYLADGLARTNNLRVRGVQALVLLEGHSDLREETQDLRVLVVPQINAGTASLAYAAINPAVGLGTFLAQVVLRESLTEAGTRELRVGGTWGEPTVDAVDRKPEAPETPATEATTPRPP